MRVQEATRRETGHIALGVLAFSAVMHLVFWAIGRWELGVLWGNLLGGGFAVLNFLLLGLTVQKIAGESDEKRARLKLQGSYTLRMLLTLGVIVIAIKVPCFVWPAAVIPLLFPRLTILAMQAMGMYRPEKTAPTRKGEDEPL